MIADETAPSHHDYQDHLSAYANMSSHHDYQDELVVPQQRHQGKSDDEVVLPRQEQHDEETTIPAEGAKDGQANSSATAFQVLPEVTTDEPVHTVLLGDSTLDNYRYLDLTAGERTVEMLLSKRCKEMNWDLTVLAMDGSTLEDVAVRQVPVVPDATTHLIISASGNDLLRLLNEMSSSEFAVSSMYKAVTTGLEEVSRKYRRILESLLSIGCHIACCTVYKPNFQHIFLKALAGASLGVHNGRIREIAEDLDISVLDFANICIDPEDFANPLELSTRGGGKVVENITHFVRDHSVSTVPRLSEPSRPPPRSKPQTLMKVLGLEQMCCVSCKPSRRIYADLSVSEVLASKSMHVGDRSRDSGPTEFAEAQEKWRQS
mmetsp:Transcript_101117/g.241014  ORF Transcript_101117/g.241014 Transcript_101117/m.241014 type:complete len:376 (-) Transcript_101117:23-1150(-)